MLTTHPSKESNVQVRIKKNAIFYGNKAANLIELDILSKDIKCDGLQVQIPDIFPINDATIKAHLDKHANNWRTLWSDFTKAQHKQKTLTNAAKKHLAALEKLIIYALKEHPFSVDMLKSSGLSPDTLLMVRSTGEEDTLDIANPGGNESVAAVSLDAKAIGNAISTVITSYLSKKSLTQRLLSGDDITKEPFMPVLIQKMIGEKLDGEEKPENVIISGVMYAKNNITRIEAAPGHGELIVNSKSTFDSYDVTVHNVVHAEIYRKPTRLIPAEIESKRKLIFKKNPKTLEEQPALPSDIVAEMARIAQNIAKHYQMPMDIEFVYHPKEKILYIVQARPIPKMNQKIQPSAIAPERWIEIKRNPQIKKTPLHIVSPGGNATKIITAKEQVITADNISLALKHYLKNPTIHGKIRAVLIKNPAASTSHEAAQFNALGIPVVQTEHLETVKQDLTVTNPVLIIDPQHQSLVNWTHKSKDSKAAEKTLLESKIVVEGLFASSLNAKKTLLPLNPIDNKAIGKTIKKYLDQKLLPVNNIYQTLLNCFDTLEGVKCDDKNSAAFAALSTISGIFRRIGTSARSEEKDSPHQQLFQHAMLSIAEIDLSLQAFSSLSSKDNKTLDAQKYLLDLIAKLKALVTNPGDSNLYSDSILQIAMQNKARSKASLSDEKPTPETEAYCIEFSKLNELALNSATQTKWAEFALTCSQKPFTRKLLAKIIKICHEHHLLSDLINISFLRHWDKSLDHSEILANLFEEIIDNEREFKRLKFDENRQIIASFEKRIPDWSQPEKFDGLLKEFKEELMPLINRLSINDDMSNLTKKAVLKQVRYLTEVIDQSIKSLKGSPEYSEKDTHLLIERFVSLLTPYHALMEKWMGVIPAGLYSEWARRILRNEYNTKNGMIDIIRKRFLETSKDRTAKQLHPSNSISVASITVGTTASMDRQFVSNFIFSRSVTLEDLFSLFHQNILASTVILGKTLEVDSKQLPGPLKKLVTNLNKNNSLKLLGISDEHPIVTVEYNMPLRNHSAKFTLSYNKKSKAVRVRGQFFGHNLGSRMDTLAEIAEYESIFLKPIVHTKPAYNSTSRSLTFDWEFSFSQINFLSQNISKIFNSYSQIANLDMPQREARQEILMRYHNHNLPQEVISKDGAAKLIIAATQEGFLEVVKSLIEKYPDLLNHRDEAGETPLICAAYGDHENIIAYLISKGADVELTTENPADHCGRTALYGATASGHTSIVTMLAKAGAVTTTALGPDLLQPIHLAALRGDLALIKALIENNPKLLDATDKFMQTPLLLAVNQGHFDIVKYLISKGADISVATNRPDDAGHGNTPLWSAIAHKNKQLIKLLIKAHNKPSIFIDEVKAQLKIDSDREATTVNLDALLLFAAELGQAATVDFLITQGAHINVQGPERATPLLLAVEHNHKNVIDILLDNKADTSIPAGNPPLHAAIKLNRINLVKSILKNTPSAANHISSGNRTPLHLAAQIGNASIVKLLIDHGADINARSTAGATALLFAIEHNHKDVIAILLKYGADTTIPLKIRGTYHEKFNVKPGDTTLHAAVKLGRLDLVITLLDKGANPLTPNTYGSMPLHLAAQTGDEKMVDLLIHRGAKINTQTPSGATALLFAIEHNHKNIVDLLLEHKADTSIPLKINSTYHKNFNLLVGFTPLHAAIKLGRLDMVVTLIKNGASINALTAEGLTPLQLATQNKQTEIAGYLNLLNYIKEISAREDGHFKNSFTLFNHTKTFGFSALQKKEAALALKSIVFDKVDKEKLLQTHAAALNNGELQTIFRSLKI